MHFLLNILYFISLHIKLFLITIKIIRSHVLSYFYEDLFNNNQQ